MLRVQGLRRYANAEEHSCTWERYALRVVGFLYFKFGPLCVFITLVIVYSG